MRLWRKIRRLFAPSVRVNEWFPGQFVAVFVPGAGECRVEKRRVDGVTASGRALVGGLYYTAAGNCVNDRDSMIYPWSAKHQRALNRAKGVA